MPSMAPHRRVLLNTASHLAPATVAPAPTAAASDDAPKYALPPIPLDSSTDLPSATSATLTLQEVEHFKEFGFVVKRGLIPKETLLPWVDRLWAATQDHPVRELLRDCPNRRACLPELGYSG